MPQERCGVKGCEEKARESHHIWPLEYGGAQDGPRFLLCPTHHTSIHDMARECSNGRLTLGLIKHPDLKLLVKGILEQKAVFEATGEAPEARRRLVAHLSEEEQQMVHLIKNHYAFSSLEKLVKWMIRREAERIGYTPSEED